MNAMAARCFQLNENQLVAVRKAKEQLQLEFPVESVRLFGSYSRGEAFEDSDIDLLY